MGKINKNSFFEYTRGKRTVDCYWFTNPYHEKCMGMIKCYDSVDKKYKYYVGFGDGKDEKEDIQLIIAFGIMYNEEDFISIFKEFIDNKNFNV